MEHLNPCNDSGYAAQTIAYTDTAAALTTAYKPGPNAVHVVSTTDCYVRVGEGVTATSGDVLVSAGIPYVIHVNSKTGANWTVSAIRLATSGTLYVKPVQE